MAKCTRSTMTLLTALLLKVMSVLILLTILGSFAAATPLEKEPSQSKVYEPTWDSLDSRPLPAWYDQAKFGIFIHWGIFSVPSWSHHLAEWYYQYLLTGSDNNETREFHYATYGQDFKYDEFGPMFKAELWDPAQWTQLFSDAGAKFVLLTSKHCDGWANWKSPAKWNYNSVDNGPHRDIVGELTNATRAQGLRMGLYYCNIEWGNPLLPWDYMHGPEPYTGQEEYVEEVFLKELKDITVKYQPDIVNGDYAVLLNSTQLKSRDFLAWLYNESPVKDTVVVDDRWGTDTRCLHGGYHTCHDRYEPGALQPHKWTDLMTMANSWGYDRVETVDQYKTAEEMVSILVNNVAYGGNLILNIGPTHDGIIIPLMAERLLQIGSWLKVNGDAIYGTQPWKVKQAENSSTDEVLVYYTTKTLSTAGTPAATAVDDDDASTVDLYAILMSWPTQTGTAQLANPPCSAGTTTASLLTGNGPVTLGVQCWTSGTGINISMPTAGLALDKKSFPTQYAYTIRLQNSLTGDAVTGNSAGHL
ncbi:alpha-L-fucosidase-like isoform X1 [Sycon ciliatum]|uniref:alpha-L-fucosidase-like isoform X1 n=2 Tax=Sycon ciliatum TaxID=27933 RepID=UPI0031F5F13C